MVLECSSSTTGFSHVQNLYLFMKVSIQWHLFYLCFVGIILGMGSANDRRHYMVMSFVIGWTHTQNDPCFVPSCPACHIDGLVQERRISTANAGVELRLSCTHPSSLLFEACWYSASAIKGWSSFVYEFNCLVLAYGAIKMHCLGRQLGPLLLICINFNPCMDK